MHTSAFGLEHFEAQYFAPLTLSQRSGVRSGRHANGGGRGCPDISFLL